MFKITFISSTIAYAITCLGLVAITGINNPNSSDPAFVIGYVIGVVGVCAAIGALAGGIAVLMFRPSAIRA